jgi:transcriptional regulator with PAS, ATPase and Fis domain
LALLCQIAGQPITGGAFMTSVRDAERRTIGKLLVGHSASMQEVAARIDKLANSSVPVVVIGETGTGKEEVARALHLRGPRAALPFVPVNCGALNRELLESELFGHEAGAFTGARGERVGCFEAAGGGTVLLDEIGEAPLDLQVKLLRVLQAREVTRVGSSHTRRVDARVIAATHRNLPQGVREGTFRADLLYRLGNLTIALAPLRRRLEDVDALVEHFLVQNQPPDITATLSPASWELLRSYRFPGNVRQLEMMIIAALALQPDDWVIEPEHLFPPVAWGDEDEPDEATAKEAGDPWEDILEQILRVAPAPGWEHIKERLAGVAIRRNAGSVVAAALELGVDRSTLRRYKPGRRALGKD